MSGPGRGLLIDASNLHVGGGVQVGASVLNEMAGHISAGDAGEGLAGQLTAMVSAEVASNLEAETWTSGLHILTVDSSPRRWAGFPETRYESIFTVFGPSYRRRRADREIAGFARGLMIYPRTDVQLPRAGMRERLLDEVRWTRFRAADVLVTETPDSALRVGAKLERAEMRVVPNCVARGVSHRSLWHRIPVLDRLDSNAVLLCAVAVIIHIRISIFLGRLALTLSI